MTGSQAPETSSPVPRGYLSVIVGVLFGAVLLLTGVGPAVGAVTIPADPNPPAQPGDPDIEAQRTEVMRIARQEVSRRVLEREWNVPRYRNGRGRIAPYSIGDQWCAAFATWAWGRAGFESFRTARRQPEFLRSTFSGETVAVQVRDLRAWAKTTRRWTLRATPGDLVAYGDRHIGIVMAVDRRGRAVRTIEGNLSNRVRWFEVPMTEVIDYFSPVPLTATQRITRTSPRADVD